MTTGKRLSPNDPGSYSLPGALIFLQILLKKNNHNLIMSVLNDNLYHMQPPK